MSICYGFDNKNQQNNILPCLFSFKVFFREHHHVTLLIIEQEIYNEMLDLFISTLPRQLHLYIYICIYTGAESAELKADE